LNKSRVTFFNQPYTTQIFFTCPVCDWVGSELELDIYSSSSTTLVCCPCCQELDIRVLNSKEFIND